MIYQKSWNNSNDLSLFIVLEIGIYEGIMLIAKPTYYFTDLFFDHTRNNLKHNHLMKFINQKEHQTPLEYRELQRDARIGINLWCVDSRFKSFWLGSAGITLFTQDGFLKQGDYDIYLWPLERFKKEIIWFGMNHVGDKETRPTITISLNKFKTPIKFIKSDLDKDDIFARRTPEETNKFEERIEFLKNKGELEKDEQPNFLPLFMKSLNSKTNNSWNIKRDWDDIDPNAALGLLQPNNTLYSSIPHRVLREHAVDKVNTCSNRALAEYMPQLVQALKSEPFHSSYLSETLLLRALESPRVVGHALFWTINTCLYDKIAFERLYLIYERFLFLCSDYRNELFFQSQVNDMILWIGHESTKRPPKVKKEEFEKELTKKLNDGKCFWLL
jgi:hypothetical protein